MSTTTTTNGASLEDCLTNIFSLIDLNGLRWKRFKLKETQQTTNNFIHANHPSVTGSSSIDTHPILTTYAKCLEENLIASWRFEPQKRHHGNNQSNNNSNNHHQHGGSASSHHNHGAGGNSMNSSNFPTPTRTSNNNTPTSAGPTNNPHNTISSNNSNNSSNPNNNLELWIFGYGHQLKVDNVIGEDLVEVEDDTWESKGLSYDCRTLLFKALHNLIERCLISKGYTKIGRWFVQPCRTNFNNNNHHHNFTNNNIHNHDTFTNLNINDNQNLSYHLVQTIMEQQQQLAQQQLSSTNSILSSNQTVNNTSSNQHYSTLLSSNLNSNKLTLSFSFSFFVHGDSTVCTSIDVRHHPAIHTLNKQDLNTFQEGGLVRVILAPYGLNGILNGISYKDNDNTVASSTFIRQWSKFFPIPETMARLFPGNTTSSAMPKTSTSNAGPTSASTASKPFNQIEDGLPTRSYLSNLTNMLVSPHQGYKTSNQSNYDMSYEMPPIVEVIVAGQRMRYPTECIFTASKFVDPYKSICAPTTPRAKVSSFSIKRPHKNSPGKSNKSSLLSQKLTEDNLDSHLGSKIKSEVNDTRATQQVANADNPFKLARFSQDGKSYMQATPNYVIKSDGTDKPSIANNDTCITNHYSNSTLPNGQKLTSSVTNTTISRLTTSKVGSLQPNSNNTALGPNDLVKIYPTPPSLEQNVLSPHIPDETTTINSATNTQLSSTGLQQSDSSKYDEIDVYRPVECFVMQPPPKWAALTNIVIPNSKSLPPQCIYKASSQKTSDKIINTKNPSPIFQDISAKSINHTGPNQTQNNNNKLLNKINNITLPSQLPLKDQTNKNEFNRSPTKTIGMNLLDNSTIPNNAISANLNTHGLITSSTTTTITTTSTFSSFSLPHQILFNNLVEVSSIQFNLMLSDSVVSMILDHNFESCTLCVCNMSIKGSHYDVIPQKSETSNRFKQNNIHITNNDIATNDYVNECTCGFSATVTRHSSHLSGLFYEDELDLTNLLYDPTEMIDQNKLFRKVRLSSYNESCYNEEKKLIAKLFPESVQSTKEEVSTAKLYKDNNLSSSLSNLNITDEETKITIIDQLKQQSSTSICSNSSLSKVLLTEALRNNRHPTSCINYASQITYKSSLSCTLDENSRYTTVKVLHRNPVSLKYTDLCEVTKNIINKIASPSSTNTNMTRTSNPIVKPINQTSTQGSAIAAIFSSMMAGASRSPRVLDKSSDIDHRNNIFIQGLQSLILPTLTVDPKGALHMLEHLLKEESKNALATLNRAILIFASPLHDWQFIATPMPENNFDVANMLKSIQPILYDAVGMPNKLYKDYIHQQQQHIFSSRDSPTGAPTVPTPPCQGPLTWRQFHLAAGSDSEDHHEPQPIPSLLVGHQVEKSHLALSPFALKFWDKLLLEPYAPGHNIYYLVIGPNIKDIPCSNHYRSFFKELSNMYELMKLGKHMPIGTGILLADPIDNTKSAAGSGTGVSDKNKSSSAASEDPTGSAANSESKSSQEDGMFHKLNPMEKFISKNIVSQIKAYYSKLDSNLAKAIVEFLDERQPPYDPHEDRFESSSNLANRPVCGMSSRVACSQKSNNSNQAPITTYRQMFKQLFGPHLRQVQQQHLQHQQQQQSHQQQLQQQQQYPYSQGHSMMDQSHHPFENSSFLGGISSLGGSGSLIDQQHFGSSGNNSMLLPGDLNTTSSSLLNSSGSQGASQSMLKPQSLLSGGSSSHPTDDAAHSEDETNKQTGLVIYMIDPFTSLSLNQNLRVPAIIGLIKCYTELLEHLPEHIRRIAQLQLISLDSLICHSRPVADISRLDQLKSLSMNVFARCKRVLTNQITAKSLTGFGPAAALENFFKSKKLDLCISKVFTPPFILAPTKDKQTELGEMFGDRREKSSVLFCSYCITEDQRWLLASVTNDRGEMSETTVININVTERTKRPKASVKRLALRKLMEFIISVMSEWMNPWRLIIGKLGRLGHGELKEWANLLSKASLLNYSRQLLTKCGQCSILPATETVSILSACLVSLEPDSKLRVMPDQFTNDDRQASFNKCPLSTPEDASATHILVFPTSASIHSTHGIVEDPLVGSGLDDDLLNQFPLDDGIEDLGVEGNMDDLFSAWPDDNQAGDLAINSHHDTMMSSSSNMMSLMQGGSGLGGEGGQHGHMLETAQLLQQPLALGYYISTAKLGPMPNWFWSTSPHLRNSSPVFLKSALHIHMPCVQLSDDLLHSSVSVAKKSHQLDSNLTTDVLRYVLEGYNSLSWLSLHSKTYDRQSCLPVHMQNLLQLYYMMESFS